MIVECKDKEGFEDQLTAGKVYAVWEARNNSYKINNDKEDLVWYGKVKFDDTNTS